MTEQLTLTPLARASDPQTSRDAAASVTPTVTRLEDIVYGAIRLQGAHGATGAEIEVLTNLQWQTLSPRFAPLRRKGLIRANGTRPGRSNRKQIVWVAIEPSSVVPPNPGTVSVLAREHDKRRCRGF